MPISLYQKLTPLVNPAFSELSTPAFSFKYLNELPLGMIFINDEIENLTYKD